MSGNAKARAVAAMLGAAAMLWTAPSVGALIVTKDATGNFIRTYTWGIDKTANASAITLPVGATQGVNYTITVTPDAGTDGSFVAIGNILIANTVDPNNPGAPLVPYLLTGLSDTIVGQLDDTVFIDTNESTCNALAAGTGFTYFLGENETLLCRYLAPLPDKTTRENLAVVQALDLGGGPVSAQDTADVIFGDPTIVYNECVSVSDSNAGSLGLVCTQDAPKSFTYTRTIGPYGVPGDYSVTNTATFTTNDTGTTGSASWTVGVKVPQPAPEPGTLALLGIGLAGLAATRRRKQ